MKTRRITLGAALMAAVTTLAFSESGFATSTAQNSTAVPAVQPSSARTFSPGVTEVVKLFKAGMSVDVMNNFINNAELPFYLSADDIVYLQQQGLPSQVTAAILQRDGVLRRQAALAARQNLTQPGSTATANQPVQVPAQAPAPAYYPDTASAPAYDYYDPGYYGYYYYNYPYYYWPPVYYGYMGGFGYGGRYYNGGHVGGFGGVGHVGGGFGGGGHVVGHIGGGFSGGGHVGGGGHIGGGFGGGGHGGGGGRR